MPRGFPCNLQRGLRARYLQGLQLAVSGPLPLSVHAWPEGHSSLIRPALNSRPLQVAEAPEQYWRWCCVLIRVE
jgi:hypothetical protein